MPNRGTAGKWKEIMYKRHLAESIRANVESIMRSRQPAGRLRCLGSYLWLFSILYGGGTKLRRDLYRLGRMKVRRLPVPVICVGNLTVGGTGKTPLVLHLAQRLQNMGVKPVIVSRGYKGKTTQKASIVCDGQRVLLSPDEAGDEPVMLASHLIKVPVTVGRDRYAAGTLAVEAFDPDVVLLDDGFQHLALARDLNLVLLDANEPFGNGHLLPRGILREPASALLDAHALVLTRKKTADPTIPTVFPGAWGDRPIFQASHRPYLWKLIKARRAVRVGTKFDLADLNGKRVYLFSGIGRNDDFNATVRNLGGCIADHLTFADHYRYSALQLAEAGQMAVRLSCKYLVTTEKDYARIAKGIDLPLDLVVLGIDIKFPDSGFDDYIDRFLERTLRSQNRV
jgi:tetraacyldisaccharide 4'-kinase